MAWNELSPNQMVSFTDAQSSPFLLNPGESSVTSNQCIDKATALTKYALSSSAMDAYDSNQLVPKSVWFSSGGGGGGGDLIDSCVSMDLGSFTSGQLYAVFSITFSIAPVSVTNFTVNITGLTSGFSTSKTLSTSDLTSGGVFWTGTTVPEIGSGYDVSESGFSIVLTPVNDGTYYHQLCAVTGYVGNTAVSQAFQKLGCPTGESGSYVTYTVPANRYFAGDLTAANALATNDLTANGQNYANTSGVCLVNTINAIISVDMYNDDGLDVCGYIDTPGVNESGNIVARSGQNFYLTTDPAASAYMLASDNIAQPTLKRRFLFNIGKLIAQYPNSTAVPEFIFKIRGRSSSGGIKNGVWQREYPDVTMVMTGSPGSYIPTTSPSGGPPADSWTANVTGGGDGSVGIGVGSVIMTFTYTRATNTITLVTA